MKKLTFLGTASGYPTPTRTVSGILLHHPINGNQWLFDCGEGTQVQIQKLKDAKFKRITKIFITHLHGDHAYGLPGLLSTMAQTESDDTCIDIYGPIGLKKLVRVCLGLANHHLNFKYSVHEILVESKDCPDNWTSLVSHETIDPPLPYEIDGDLIKPVFDANGNGAWKLFYDDGCKATAWAVPLKHSIPSLGFIILFDDRPGQLNIEKALKLGVPKGPLLGQLKNGENIILSNGETVYHSDVVLQPLPGLNIAILGDTSNSDSLISFMERREIKVGLHHPKLNYLVHESTFENGMEEHCIKKGHSSPKIAAEIAQKLDVDNLILTHFSQRYANEGDEVRPDHKVVTILKDQILEDNIFSGNVILASDLMSVDLK